ncbi:uncharacterized protein MONOS_3755 [Monocercomonoides exilis]|uniref:uncharacterized protein n=1 Tax=Monocercomonoides exilis TaxID=2049356 RepID=UPI003559F636|nr:hypothetical protein MONOS_3755 [Monocercomonoides exilis]|eukprot:MONOS_3755.1-p1 / transcript=MONOS_3755.1 / gene=MONOS_3755 / organism=Monocercomonoides_exilis_PA203 / gene_product=unspecified product / transcript_product=unspecified product / location=Mono_scaffold00091:84619-85365(+) / protein_length=249 / sequence_SO=supercontig / SO=protein_coding / is_pseudo=false
MYFSEMKEIIQHHQEHNNLTRLAYHSAWEFIIKRFCLDESLEDVISNELHFAKEAIKELEELMNCVDWKRTEEEREKESQEELILKRWLQTLVIYFSCCRLKNEENAGLINSIVQVYQTAKGNNEEIGSRCIYSLSMAAKNRAMKNEDLLESGAVDIILEEIQQPTLNDKMVCEFLDFFETISWRLNKKTDDEIEEEEFDEGDEERDEEKEEEEEAKRKELKRKMFEKLEEEGYEDIVTSFNETFGFF